MEFADVVTSRRMVRRFAPEAPLDPAALGRILDHATRAPSAGFTQGWEFLVLTEPADRARFWSVTAGEGEPDAWLRGVSAAPALVVCLSDPDAYLDRYARPDKGGAGGGRDQGSWAVPYWDVDTGMAALLMLLTAVDEGLGALFFGVPGPRHDDVREAFDVPPGLRIVGVVAIGTPAPDTRPADRGRPRPHRPARRRARDVVHPGRFGARPAGTATEARPGGSPTRATGVVDEQGD